MTKNVILAEISFISSETTYGFPSFNIPSDVVPAAGESYAVVFDGQTYNCVAFSYDIFVCYGNGSPLGMPGKGEPFGVIYDTTNNINTVVCFQDTEPTQHTIAVYTAEINPNVILEECELSGFVEGEASAAVATRIVAGETYNVTWDGTVFKCKAYSFDAGEGVSLACLGNQSYIERMFLGGSGDIPELTEPFWVRYVPGELTGIGAAAVSVMCMAPDCYDAQTDNTLPGASNTHRIGISKVVQTVILTEQKISGFTTSESNVIADVPLEDGKTYVVMWDGIPYKCIAYTMEVLPGKYSVFIGNPEAMEWYLGGMTGDMPEVVEPFAINYLPSELTNAEPLLNLTCIEQMLGTCSEDSHRVGVNLYSDNDVFFEEQEVSGFVTTNNSPDPIMVDYDLVPGETYTVVWDGEWYDCTAYSLFYEADDDGDGTIDLELSFKGLGNKALIKAMYDGIFGEPVETEPDIVEPFAIIVAQLPISDTETQLVATMICLDTDCYDMDTGELLPSASDTHTVGVYKGDTTDTDFKIILPYMNFDLTYHADDNSSTYWNTKPVGLVNGKTYKIIIDDQEYFPVVAKSAPFGDDASIIYLGNLAITNSGSNTGENYLIGESDQYSLFSVNILGDVSSCKIAIYEYIGPEIVEPLPDGVILPETTYDNFVFDAEYGMHTPGLVEPAEFILESGKTYTVVWNSLDYTCTAVETVFNGANIIAIGRTSILRSVENNAPFLICYDATNNASQIFSTEKYESNTIAIYEPEDGIIIKNPRGVNVVYGDYKKIRLNKASGEKVIYSEGEVLDNVNIVLDFSNGDQTVRVDDGYLVKEATIKQPDQLKPEHIKQGIVIANIEGSLVVPNEATVNITPRFSTSNIMTIKPNEGSLFSSVVIMQPDDLIPDNIPEGKYIAGVGPGTFQSSAKDIETEAEMNALLVTANIGKVYRFIGETTDNYINGDIYVVEEAEEIA